MYLTAHVSICVIIIQRVSWMTNVPYHTELHELFRDWGLIFNVNMIFLPARASQNNIVHYRLKRIRFVVLSETAIAFAYKVFFCRATYFVDLAFPDSARISSAYFSVA